jgi:ferredoxin
MNECETGALTPAMLSGTPVGGPGGFAACDTCNRSLTDGHREHDPDDAEADTVYAYATRVRGTSRWTLRWVSCEACGPPGDDEDTDDEPGEAVAKATLTYDGRIDAFALADPEVPDRTGGNS